jgi:hypothetical protein
MNSTIYTMNYNSIILATCKLTLMTYEYNELQMSSIIQKLNCKASYKTTIFLIVMWMIPTLSKSCLEVDTL